MIKLELTEDIYHQVERFLSQQFGYRVRRKEQSLLMRVFAKRFLARAGIIDGESFMNRFTTTLPLPFRSTVCFIAWDNREPMTGVQVASRINTLTHETEHVVQMGTKKQSRRRWATGYAVDPSFRVRQEIEAYHVTQCIFAHTTNHYDTGEAFIDLPAILPSKGRRRSRASLQIHMDNGLSSRQGKARLAADAAVDALQNYGLRERDIDIAREVLHDRAVDPSSGWYTESGRALLELLVSIWNDQADAYVPAGVEATHAEIYV